jgi:sterol desaturase/sphingolipid hydroxylase (fatty acid hydroxylase superfamily)
MLEVMDWSIDPKHQVLIGMVRLVGFFAFVAFTHEVYHTDENLVFWVDRPIHHFHHAKNQWKHNFAFTNTLMDRLFGTFLDDPTWSRKPVRLRELLKVRWL